jgi:transglutaminase-like putative cysteine protease
MCVGYAEALELILRCATDVEVQILVGDSMNRTDSGEHSGDWVGHAWNVVNMDGFWYHVDPTFDDPIGNAEGISEHCYFGQSDTVMQEDHRWTEGFAPTCDAGNFFYYRKSGLMASDKTEFETVVRNIVKNGDPTLIEVATSGLTINEKSLRFIFSANENIGQILWKQYAYADITVLSIEPQY